MSNFKIACLSDPHMTWNQPANRFDDVESTSLKKFEYVLEYCADNDMPLLIAGDFVDSPRSWYFLPKLIDLILSYDVKIYVVRGQHDSYMRVENNTTILGVLGKSGLITLVNGQKVHTFDGGKFDRVFIYGFDYIDNFRFEKLPQPKFVKKTLANILLIHAPISIDNSNFFDSFHPAKVFKKWDLVVCGDIHKKFVYFENSSRPIVDGGEAISINSGNTTAVINTGPMMRLNATDEMKDHKPCFFVYDVVDRTVDEVIIPHKKFEKVFVEKDIHFESADQVLDAFIVKMQKWIPKIGRSSVKSLFIDFSKSVKVEKEIINFIFEMLEKYDGSDR